MKIIKESLTYVLNKLGELLSMALFWIPAFAGMTATWLILSFQRKRESRRLTPTY